MHPAEASHGDLGMIAHGDVVIAISNSGETEEILKLIPFFKRFNLAIISMTGDKNSTIARLSNVNIDISVREEACPLGIAPTSSTTATLAMGDALAVVLLNERGFRTEDFASFHPGGALGKRYFVTVSDLMYTEDSLPIITAEAQMTEAIVVISSKRLGIAIVTDEDRRILGVITDGDLRRGIEKWGSECFKMDALSIMTKYPKTIAEEELALKALSIMEEYSITTLIIPDKSGRAKGVVHIHDIIKKGIV
ncbi:KpsF/GutQ family protein [Candidatus Omnitrophus magneticus]|uniref:KpsF/GutQ family protein n=1 Tax=Candidatus Omnitrophus magneticus TaxID=1609969 RepID=A0A0F0CJQ7_9BACT|nr:KpsF/GutQ family protein [Candidatus Omnitrophus magneticus]